MRNDMQPFGKLLHTGPPQQAAAEWAGAHEHVLDAAMDHVELVDAPEQPFQPRFCDQRRDAERPRAFGPQPEPPGHLLPGKPRHGGGSDSRRDDVNPARPHAVGLAPPRHARRHGDHAIGSAQGKASGGIPGADRQMADNPRFMQERPRPADEQCLRPTP